MVCTRGARDFRQISWSPFAKVWALLPTEGGRGLDSPTRTRANYHDVIFGCSGRFALLSACFQSRPSLAEFGLDIHDSELAVFLFAMRGHRPEKPNPVARNRNIGMVTLRHQNRVAIANGNDQFGIFLVGVHELQPKGRR